MNVTRAVLRSDLLAGLTVTLVGLPQCLAYAMVAGLPPAYGLSTAAVAGLVAALVGRAPNVATGPTNTTGLLVLAALAPYLGPNGLLEEQFLPILASLALMAGVFRIVAALLGGAHLVRFIAESVLTGFMAGAGILIAVMQFDEAVGLTRVRGANLWSQLQAISDAHDSPKMAAIVITALTVAAIATARRIRPSFPMPLIVVVLAMIAAPFIRDAGVALPVIADAAAVPSGWPTMALPSTDWSVYRDLALPSFAIVLLGTMELTVSLRRGGRSPDVKREIIAQGAANTVGAFLASFPASASLTRSALLETAGGRTRLAAIASAIFVLPAVFFGSGLLGVMPQASLAGVLLYTAYRMLNLRRARRIWQTSRASRLLLAVTFIGTVTLPFVWAILIGVGLALAIQLAVSSEPRFTLLAFQGDRVVPYSKTGECRTVVVEISGALYFAAVDNLAATIAAMIPPEANHVIIDLTHAHQARFAAIQAFEELQKRLLEHGTRIGLCGVSERFSPMIRRAGVTIPYVLYDPTPGAAALDCRGLLRGK